MHSPTQAHLNATLHILGYLQGTPEKGLLFRKTEDRDIVGFIDADYAISQNDIRYTSGFCTKLWGNLVS